MKKLILSLFVLVFVAFNALAQDRVITGTVTSTDNSPIPGASVKVEGAAGGAATDASGKYTIRVSADAKALTITSVGYTPQTVTIGARTVINVKLESDTQSIDQVVITGAYGTKVAPRSATSNSQNLAGDKLNTVNATNLNNAMAGKVAGVQIRSQSTAALGRNTDIRLRGGSGFGTGTGVLYVVDGTILPNADDLNLDDVEDLTVLQGPAAAAILGSQAANGAILITTKKGRKGTGTGLSVNLNTTVESIARMMDFQDVYAGGANPNLQTYTWNASQPVEWQALNGKKFHNYSDDSSWGPKMDGSEYIPWYAWYPGSQYSYKTASLTPQPDNARDFFETGITANNSVAYSNSGDNYTFRMNYGNQYTNGLVPTTSLAKNTLQLNASYDVSKQFTIAANWTYVNTKLNGEINDGYSNSTTGGFNQWMHRDLDMGKMKELRGLTAPGGFGGRPIYGSWNHADPGSYNPANPLAFYGANYWYNFYTYQDLIDVQNNRDRLYGNLALSYKITPDLKITGTYRKQQNTVWGESIRTSDLEFSANQTGEKASYSTSQSYSNRENYEFVANYSKKIKDFTVDAMAGMDFFTAQSKANGASTVAGAQGLTIPDVYRIANSFQTPSVSNSRTKERYRAVFARAQFGYKNLLFLEGTIRNDYFASLPVERNDVLSKSFGGSFVFSDLINKNNQMPWLSEAKIRGSWGEIPQTIGNYVYPGFSYGISANKWSDYMLMSTPDQLVDPQITGAVATSKDLGIDFKLLNRRLNFSATYWDKTEKGFPRSVTVNAASGFSSILTNVGRVEKEGLEFQLGGTPIRTPNFTWTANATYANLLNNKIVEISDKYNITRFAIANSSFGNLPQTYHEKGQQWGIMYGRGITRNADGVPVVDANGYYVTGTFKYWGAVEPKHTGGLQNNFTIMNAFDISANIDWQVGGKFASLSQAFGSYSGLTERTAVLNDKGVNVRESVANGGGVRVVGVTAAGVASDKYVPVQTYYVNMFDRATIDDYVHDLTFVKLREVAIGYRIPVAKLGLAKVVSSASFAITARNPVIIYSTTKDFDPAEISGTNGESGQFPSTRGFGFNLRVGF